MESAREVQQKGRLLVNTLLFCLARSKVAKVVDGATLRTVIESALGELWREGEFRLEVVWKLLCQQPGLSGSEVAPPLLWLKTSEQELGVTVRLPEGLASVPRAEQARLRSLLPINDAELAKQIAELRSAVLAAPADAAPAKPVPMAASKSAATTTAPARRPAPESATGAPRTVEKSRLTTVQAAALLAVAGVALTLAIYFTVRDPSSGFDTSDVSAILQVGDARRVGDGFSGRITDGRWEAMAQDERQRVAAALFDIEAPKGIHVMTLTDQTGRISVIATEAPEGRQVTVH